MSVPDFHSVPLPNGICIDCRDNNSRESHNENIVKQKCGISENYENMEAPISHAMRIKQLTSTQKQKKNYVIFSLMSFYNILFFFTFLCNFVSFVFLSFRAVNFCSCPVSICLYMVISIPMSVPQWVDCKINRIQMEKIVSDKNASSKKEID